MRNPAPFIFTIVVLGVCMVSGKKSTKPKRAEARPVSVPTVTCDPADPNCPACPKYGDAEPAVIDGIAQAVRPAKVIQVPDVEPRGRLSRQENKLLAAINRWRQDRDLQPLLVDDTLQAMARERVGQFSHRHSRYGLVTRHAASAGFHGVCTDNLARGYPSPTDAVRGWGNEEHSVGHDKQMAGYRKLNGRWRNEQFNVVGVAVEGKQYIAIFGRRTTEQPQVNTISRKTPKKTNCANGNGSCNTQRRRWSRR